MAATTGAHTSYTHGPSGDRSNREDLSDILYDVSPTDTPGLTAIGTGSQATATLHEHLTDHVRGPADNANIEGADAVPTQGQQRIRMHNYTQSFKEWVVVSHTQERVLKGGSITSEVAHQTRQSIRAIKTDVERAIFGVNNAYVAGDDSTAREMASFTAYMGDENGAVGLPGNSYAGLGTAPSGDGSDIPTPGVATAFDEDRLKAASTQLWDQAAGNESIILLCGSKQRSLMSSFQGSATRYVTTDDASLQASLDVYRGDYHTMTVSPDRFCLADTVFLLDPEYASLSNLEPLNVYDIAKLGDAYRKEMRWECTLEMSNPRAHVAITDCL